MLLVMMSLSFVSSCSWFNSGTTNTNANTNANTSVAKDETQPTPPFSTKEPEKFHAKMLFSASLGEDMPDVPPQVFAIWRDGDKRRVEFDQGEDRVAFLQTPSGQFSLNLTKKEYADLNLNKNGNIPSNVPNADNLLNNALNQTRPNAKYENLGQETIGGRITTKWRVISQETMDAGRGANEKVTVDAYVWVDESLGMPIRSETTVTGEDGHKGVKTIMEVKEIKLEAPTANVFEIPKGFKKVVEQ